MVQLIVFNIHTKGVDAALLIALPMIADSIFDKFKVSIEQRFRLAAGHGHNAMNWQIAAKIIPMGKRRTRHQDLAEHGNPFVGVENLAQEIGACSLCAYDRKKMNKIGR